MPLDFAGPFPYSNYPPLHDWHNSPSMAETPRTPSIPARVSSLPPLPVIQMDPAWEDVNYPIAGTSTRSAASSPAHSPFRDTPTPIDQSEGGSKGKKRSRGRYRKEDPADRYLRESLEDGNRLWTCMWVEPSHGTPNPPAAQSVCGHQAPKSNARQHVKSRHLKLRYVNLFVFFPSPKLTFHRHGVCFGFAFGRAPPLSGRAQAVHLPRVRSDLARPRRAIQPQGPRTWLCAKKAKTVA